MLVRLTQTGTILSDFQVFFVKSPYSEPGDDSWLCAGAIVSPTQILTAAACLVDVNKVYVIAGYKKYVRVEDVEKDKCANRSKKKVVKISVPKGTYLRMRSCRC